MKLNLLCLISCLLSSPDGVDKGKFKEREENEAGAHNEPNVNELDVANLIIKRTRQIIIFRP